MQRLRGLGHFACGGLSKMTMSPPLHGRVQSVHPFAGAQMARTPSPEGGHPRHGLATGPAPPPLTVLVDLGCSLCRREVKFVQARTTPDVIRFVDVSSPTYDPAQCGGISVEAAMSQLHAIEPATGAVVTGVEVSRRMWDAAGLGLLATLTRLPVVSTAAAAAYDLWARHRFALTGSPGIAEVLEARRRLDDGERCRVSLDSQPPTTAGAIDADRLRSGPKPLD